MANTKENDAKKVLKFKKAKETINKNMAHVGAEREELRKQLMSATPVSISDSKETKIPKGKLAAVKLGPDHLDGTGINVDVLKYEISETHKKHEEQLLNGKFGFADQAQFSDVITSVNKNYAQEKNILFFSHATNQFTNFNDTTNHSKLITGDVILDGPKGKEGLKRAINAAKIADFAYIPISLQGTGMRHEVTLVKQGNKWAFIDQYAFNTPDYLAQKDTIWKIMTENIPYTDKMTANAGNIYNNTTNSCVLFSEVMGKMALNNEANLFDEIEYLNAKGLPLNQDLIKDAMEKEQFDFIDRAMETEKYLQKYHNYQPDR